MSADHVFQYATTKKVLVNDYRLGFVYYFFFAIILFYIFAYRMLYLGSQFDLQDVEGTVQLSIMQPTVHHCNPHHASCKSDFTPLTHLSYCKEFEANSSKVNPEDRLPCMFADKNTLNPKGNFLNTFMVPTHVEHIYEEKGCQPNKTNDYRCDNEWNIVNKNSSFVADVERMTIMFTHTFHRRDVSGDNTEVNGYYLRCNDDLEKRVDEQLESSKKRRCSNSSRVFFSSPEKNKEFKKKHEKSALRGHSTSARLKHGRGAHQLHHLQNNELELDAETSADTSKGVFSIGAGDIFTVQKLLDEAGVSFDGSVNKHGESARKSGVVINVEIIYTNMHPFSSSFGNKEVTYDYKISAWPVSQLKQESLSDTLLVGDGKKRVIDDWHGLLIVTTIQGQFGFFCWMHLWILLTTSFGMIALAHYLVDKIAVKFLGKKPDLVEETEAAHDFPEETSAKVPEEISDKPLLQEKPA